MSISSWSPTDLITEPGSSCALDCLTLSSSSSCSSQFSRSRNLIGWDPWTNSRVAAAGRQLRQQQQAQQHHTQHQQQPQHHQHQPISTLKAAGRIYDSMLAAERKAAARSTNNNTKEMQGGLSDVQRHSSNGQRTTVITRLASEMATCGGVLDVNFVIDTQSSNTEFSPDSKDSTGDTSPDASTGSDNWRWTHPTPPEAKQKPGGGRGGGSEQKGQRARPSMDQLLQDSESRDAAVAADKQKLAAAAGGQRQSTSLSMQQQRQEKFIDGLRTEEVQPPLLLKASVEPQSSRTSGRRDTVSSGD